MNARAWMPFVSALALHSINPIIRVDNRRMSVHRVVPLLHATNVMSTCAVHLIDCSVTIAVAVSRTVAAGQWCVTENHNGHFCRPMLCKRGLCRHAVSVLLSVRPSRSYILSKRINVSSNLFFTVECSRSRYRYRYQSILVFPHQTAWQYSNGNPLRP